MRRRAAAALLILFSALLFFAGPAGAEKAGGDVLFLYAQDGNAQTAAEAKEVLRQVLAEGLSCDALPVSRYQAGSLSAYSYAVVVDESGGALPQALAKDLAAYAGRLARVGAGGSSSSFSQTGLAQDLRLRAAFARFLASAFGREGNESSMVFDLDEIYPVSDFGTVAKMGAYLKQKGIPFAFTVMPFYANAQTSAAAYYGSLLKQLIADGGTPVLHLPVFQGESDSDTPSYSGLDAHLGTALRNYASRGVYPAAVEMTEDALLYSQNTRFLARNSDVFLSKGDGKSAYLLSSGTPDSSLPSDKTSLSAGAAVWRELRVPSSGGDASLYQNALSALNDRYTKTYLSCPSSLSYAAFKTAVDGLVSRHVGFADLSAGSHTVRAKNTVVSQTDGAVTYDGKTVVYQPSSAASSSSAAASQKKAETGDLPFILPSMGFMALLAAALFINWRKARQKFIQRK